MRCLVLRQRYFTDICSIAVVTLALFQRSVMDLKKCGKQIKRKQLAIQHTPAIQVIFYLKRRWCKKICKIQITLPIIHPMLGINNCLQIIETGVRWVVLCLSQDGACTESFENFRDKSLKGGLSNDITLNPPLFSLENTFKVLSTVYTLFHINYRELSFCCSWKGMVNAS
jgi:hypothetical protein